jgi:hypothetical protein
MGSLYNTYCVFCVSLGELHNTTNNLTDKDYYFQDVHRTDVAAICESRIWWLCSVEHALSWNDGLGYPSFVHPNYQCIFDYVRFGYRGGI